MKCDTEKFKIFFHKMLDQGVYLAPSAFEAGFMSLAHTNEDIEKRLLPLILHLPQWLNIKVRLNLTALFYFIL